MKIKHLSLLTLAIIISLSSCDTVEIIPIKKEVFSGYVQKGPFINGTSVSIAELTTSLDQTGRTYSTTVTGNSGGFEQKQIELVSNFVQLKADGYYFNEVSGESSSGQLTLYALTDISDINSANVNVLTHLEKSRVEYLIQEEGLTFSVAKKQAQKEVLSIFNLELPTDTTSESLNISVAGDDNAILLAVSCILQGFSSTAEMTELMANIISDIKTDGTLDDASIGSVLIDNAILMDLEAVRQHLTEKYTELGLTNVVVPDFETQISTFLTTSTFTPEKKITYPISGDNGLNLLNDTVKAIPKNNNYSIFSMTAILPKGTNLRIVIKGEPIWSYSINPSQLLNWTVGQYDIDSKSQEFVVNESNKKTDLYVVFNTATIYENITIEYYENNAQTPTRIKTVVVGSPMQYIYPAGGNSGENILSDNFSKAFADFPQSMVAEIPSSGALYIVLIREGGGWVVESPVTNWTVEDFNMSKQRQTFRVTEGGTLSDLPIKFKTPGTYKLEIHENNDFIATRTKEILIM